MKTYLFLKETICAIIGAISAMLSHVLGGWDSALATLVIFMAVDFISGLVVAGVFHKSRKTESGSLESYTGWKGLCKKVMTLFFVMIAYRLDIVLNINYIRDLVIIAFITNELISITENAGLMGIPLPAVINKAIDILQSKVNDGKELDEHE